MFRQLFDGRFFSFFLLLVIMTIVPSPQPLLADHNPYFVLHTGYANLQSDGTTVYANAAGEWAASDYEHLQNFDSASVVYGVAVDGLDVVEGEMAGPQIGNISLDSQNPTIVPLSLTYDLSGRATGWYTVTFYSYAIGGWELTNLGPGFSLTIEVYVP